ncbi:MAG TPA: hypothetical protein VMR74_00880 [Gammaproteobacteria bacterium]|nr:hypothetical protein [Gammaproteobacteria bacterium]
MKPIPAMLIAALASAALPASASAQNRELQDRLRNAVRVDCRFSQLATGDWNADTTEFSAEPVEFTALFFDIDVESGTAEAEGRFGASYIVVRYAEGYLHFMQTLNSGPLYLTTILAEATTEGRLKAVHTRHEYTRVRLPGFTSRPEMYLGDCAVE